MSRLSERNVAILIALIVSVLFHLSMVSVFSIVIRVPRNEAHYASIEILQQPVESKRPARRPLLHLRFANHFVDDAQSAKTGGVELPTIELPKLKLPDLSAESSAGQQLKFRVQFGELLEEKSVETPDSWAVFTEELRGIGRALTGIKLSQTDIEPPVNVRVSNVAPGFDLTVRWMTEPKARKVLFAPSLESLWRLDPAKLSQPITVLFIVDSMGTVTDVETPVEDELGLVVEMREALKRYKFESLDLDSDKSQRGTLMLSPERSGE